MKNPSLPLPLLMILIEVIVSMELQLSLPSFPDIARAFSTTQSMVTATVSLNLLGFCLAAALYGPLSDMYGRYSMIVWATLIFFLGSAGCALTSSIEILLLCRFIQGIGAAGCSVLAPAMIIDVYKKEESDFWILVLNTVLAVGLACAPIFGGYLNVHYGWRSPYDVVAWGGGLQLFLVLFFLQETSSRRLSSIRESMTEYLPILRSLQFLCGSLVPTLLIGGYMAFISIIPFFYRDALGIPIIQFSLYQSSIIASCALMNVYTIKIKKRFGHLKASFTGSIASLLMISIMAVTVYMDPLPSPLLITGLMCGSVAFCTIPAAIVFHESITLFPEKNAHACSMIMMTRMFFSSCIIQIAGTLYNGEPSKVIMLIWVCGCASAILTLIFYKHKKINDSKP